MLMLSLSYPVAGWVADAYTGRYNTVRFGLWMMWAGTIILESFVVVGLAVPRLSQVPALYVIILLGMGVVEIGAACYRANIVQLGTDQLLDSPSDEICAFISWHLIALSVSFALYLPFLFIFHSSSTSGALMRLSMLGLVQAVCLSIALVLDTCFYGAFQVHPGKNNPLKTVVKVTKYVSTTAKPERRSAFTYDSEDVPSRFEYAKPEFGGPFTVEQVEDTKSFYKILIMLIPMGFLMTVGDTVYRYYTLLAWHVDSGGSFEKKLAVIGYSLPFYSMIAGLLFLELFLYPFYRDLIPGMFWRFGIGAGLNLLSTASVLSIDAVGHRLTNATIQSMFTTTTDLDGLDLSYYWLLIPGILSGVGVGLQATSMFEFVISQSPLHMKGLMIGVIYAVFGVAGIVMGLVHLPFLLLLFPDYTLHPGSIYGVVVMVILSACLFVFVVCAYTYTKRLRDPPHNQHYSYVENFYDKYLPLPGEEQTSM